MRWTWPWSSCPGIEHAINGTLIFQGLSWVVSDMTIAVKTARGLTYKAAAAVECFSGDTALKIATDAVQIFGAQGFSP